MAGEKEQCFLNRLSQIPLVSLSAQKVSNLYSTTKSSNHFFETTLNAAENLTKFASDKSQPLLKFLDGPVVATNKLACHQLDKLEHKYPIILSSPDVIVNKSKEYYEKSSLRSKVDSTRTIADSAIQKITYYVPSYTLDFSRLRPVLVDTFHQLQEKSLTYEANSEKVLLNLLHRTAGSTNLIVDRIVLCSKPYLSETTKELINSVALHLHDFNIGITKAESLREVKEKSLEELKIGFSFAQSLFITSASNILALFHRLNSDQLQKVKEKKFD